MTRRDALRYSLGAALLAQAYPGRSAVQTSSSRFKIGACDWSIGPAGDVNAFTKAKRIGLDGVQVSLNTATDHEHLRRPEVQQAHKEAAKQAGVSFGGLAIGLLNEIPYKSDPRTEQWVQDSVDVAKALGVKNVLLAFFSKNDLRNDPQGQKVVIDKLKQVAPKAEKAGVILGLETYLSASDHMKIIEAVGSRNVQVYYDVRNSSDMGYNIYEEIKWLGKQKQICEFHFKEYDALLGQGIVDFSKVREAIDEIGYSGWVQIENAVPKGGQILESYLANNAFVRKTLGLE